MNNLTPDLNETNTWTCLNNLETRSGDYREEKRRVLFFSFFIKNNFFIKNKKLNMSQ
jgi:hypothetical protein